MNAMTPSSQDPTDSLGRCVLATTYLLDAGVSTSVPSGSTTTVHERLR